MVTRLAEASGIATPTRAELARFDRKRKKQGSNEDWTHPHDPDAKITKMKDGRTHLAHTAEHAVDRETGAIVGVTVQDADAGDTTTMVDTLIEAADQVAAVDGASGIAEVVGDKGYHSNETMVGFADLGVRSYVSEPDRGVGARMRAGLRASNRRARHLPMRYETGLPSSVIRFRTLHASTASRRCPDELRARDSRRRSTCTGRTHAPRARADGHQTPSSTVAVRAPSPS